MRTKNILITGGAGFIGSHLCEAYISHGHQVYALDIVINKQSYFFRTPLLQKVKYVKQNICHFDSLLTVFLKIKPDYIFHLAAVSEVSVADKDPLSAYETNVIGTVNVLEAAKRIRNLKAIIIASSDKAYGSLGKRKYTESDRLNAGNHYEITKAATDMISRGYFNSHSLPTAVARFGNVYGEGDFHLSRLIPDILISVLQNKTLQIRSDGKFVRDYLYVKDVVSGYIKLAKKITNTKGQAFNFGSRDTLSVIEVIKICEASLNKKIKYKILDNAKNEIPYQSLTYTKAKRILNWQSNHRMKDRIKNIYDWYDRS